MPGHDEERAADRDIPRLRFAAETSERDFRLRPWALLALLAFGVWWVAAPQARDQTAGPQVAHGPVVPRSGQPLQYGAAVDGDCTVVNHARTNELSGWGVYTFDPARAARDSDSGAELLPTSFPVGPPPGLDSFASGSTRPQDLSQWQLGSGGRQMPSGLDDSCGGSLAADAPDVMISGRSLVLRRPGPYVYWTFDHRVHWIKVSDEDADPTPRACGNQAGSAVPAGSPPDAGAHGWHWAIDSFCTEVKWRSFSVLGPRGSCGRPTDTSAWPGAGYINQYAAGARLRLPLGRGVRGGNACGPASLLMAMLRSEGGGRAPLPGLAEVFDRTMRLTRARVAADATNDFVGDNAARLLAQLGWRHAMLGRLGSSTASIADSSSSPTLDASNEAAIDRALQHGPVVISTSLGRGPWGTIGAGHMIVLLGRAPSNPDEYVVDDPAGNYFSGASGHYGPNSCGSGVLYPRSWLLAYTTGSWFLALGPPPAT